MWATANFGFRRAPDFAMDNPWLWLNTCGRLCSMGNKDARKREIKKPPKKKPTRHDLNQAAARIFKQPIEKS
jgi:hypothetical protein